MESQQPPQTRFSEVTAYFDSLLRKAYLEQVAKAVDKDYAKEFCKRVLFEENKWIPRYSIFYMELIARYSHHYKMGDSDALIQTLDFLPQIRQIASDVVKRTKNIRESLPVFYHELHWLYQEAIEDGNMSLEEIIFQERKLIAASQERVILLLGIYAATQGLLKEFSEEEQQAEQTTVDFATNESSNIKHLTRSQQVLVTYYISQLLGIKHKKKVTKCTRALFAFLGISTNPINSDVYKKLLHPLDSSPVQTTLTNLRIVRTFFEPLEVTEALKLIDSDIEQLTASQK